MHTHDPKQPARKKPVIRVNKLTRCQLAMLAAGWQTAANRLALSLRRLEHRGRVKALAEMEALRRCAKTLNELIGEPE